MGIGMKILVIISIIIIIAATASIVTLIPKQMNLKVSSVTSKTRSTFNVVNITVNTDGQNTVVSTGYISGSRQIPREMINEMEHETSSEILSEESTVNSLKSDLNTVAQKYNYTARVTINSQFGTDNLPFSATVSGTSMLPTLKDGQNVTALKTSSCKVGDIVIVRHPDHGLIIKRVAAKSDGKVYLKSDNRNVEIINNEKNLSNGAVGIETIEKAPLDTWQPENNVIAVVKIY